MKSELAEGQVYRRRGHKYEGQGRLIRGWAGGLIDQHLNSKYIRDEHGYPFCPMTDVIERFDDGCQVGDSRLIGASSIIKAGDNYVVYIVDSAQKLKYRNGRGNEHGYTVVVASRKASFGYMGHHDTLEEAITVYDAYRGAQPEALTLF